MEDTQPLISLEVIDKPADSWELNQPYYVVLILDGDSSFSIDFTSYQCQGKHLVFLSAFQLLKWQGSQADHIYCIKFHADFYCIEYHKQEVACNGLLFNNIYQDPYVQVGQSVYSELLYVFNKLELLHTSEHNYDSAIAKTYLQLLLAISSKEKQMDKTFVLRNEVQSDRVSNFQNLLNENFMSNRSVSFYAEHYGLSVDVFSKKITSLFGKPPSKLIKERVILEAKRLLHLSVKSIKEIAVELHYQDEFYFSRFFKKQVGVSPSVFRKTVGISIIAK